MYNFIIYDQKGKISQKGVVQSKDCVIVPEGCFEVEYLNQTEVSFEEQYYDGDSVVNRPEYPAVTSSVSPLPTANNIDEIVISNLPSPATINVDGQSYVISSGSLTLTSDVPAKYKITADQWPYKPWSIEVEFVEVAK